MSDTKRKFNDFKAESSEEGQNESPDHASGAPGGVKRQKHKQGKKSTEPPKNINETKKRIRNIERRFRVAQNLPADVKLNMERELVHLKQAVADADEDKKRSKMITKYHMVRFFETRKSNRLAKQIEKQIKQCKDDAELKKLEQDLHVAQTDSLYAKFFPYRERYISLYSAASAASAAAAASEDEPKVVEEEEDKSETASSAKRALRSERPKLWGVIEKAAKKGIPSLIEIRERKLGSDSRSKPPKERPSKHSFIAKAQALKAKNPIVGGPRTTKAGEGRMELKNPGQPKRKVEENDDDSDGGFFEAA